MARYEILCLSCELRSFWYRKSSRKNSHGQLYVLWLELIVLSTGLEFSIPERLHNGLKGRIASKVTINTLLHDIAAHGRLH